MFDSLRKKLKDAVVRVAKTIKEEKHEEEQKEEIEFLHQMKKEAEIDAEEKKIEEMEKRIEEKIFEEKLEETVEKPPSVPGLEEEKSRELNVEDLKPKEKGLKEEEKIKPEIKIKKEEMPAELPEPERTKKLGFFKRLFEKVITEDDVRVVIRELELALLENDVALEVAERIGEDVKNELVNKTVRRGKIEDAIKEALRHAMMDVMKQENIDIEKLVKEKDGVFTVLFLGFNGTGKTTTLAKFAARFKKFNPVVAAGDTFRAASIEQLEEHANKAGFRLIKHQYGSDSAAVIFDAKKAALATGGRLVLADTAGRSHSNINLMDELKKVVRVNNPDLKILVLDSVTGNDIYEQSRMFNDAVGVDAIILTKADVYDKGGAALSATYTIKKPILFLGTGQNYEDLKEFKPEEIVDNLLK